MGSRGSVIPLFMSLKDKNSVPITDFRMTRFMISLDEGVELVFHAFNNMVGGEIYVRKSPSMKITDIAKAVSPDSELIEIGIRPGEKLHEQMIGVEDAPHTYEYDKYFKILPAIHEWSKDPIRINDGRLVSSEFTYTSNNNSDWMTIDNLQRWIKINRASIGFI
jgi:FlaA1/EpsC-like NDP-sugar epimerase